MGFSRIIKQLLIFALCVSSAQAAFVINEDFEGAGTPSGWVATGTTNFDYATAPLAGLQSARLTTADFAVAPNLSPDLSEEWGSFMFLTEVALPSSFGHILRLEDSGAAHNFQVTLFSTGQLSCDGGATKTTATMSAATTYFIWWHFKQGAAANATVEVWFDTVNTRPAVGGTKYNGTTNRTENWQTHVHKVMANAGTINTANVYDNFSVADTDMYTGATTPTNLFFFTQ